GVLSKFVASRLLVTRAVGDAGAAGSEVELTHESIAASWGTLRRWLTESHETLQLREEAAQAARLWNRQGRRKHALWRGQLLEHARRVVADDPGRLDGVSRSFLEESIRSETRRKLGLRAFAVGLVLALAGGTVFFALQERRASHARAQSESRQAEAIRERAQ